MKNDMSPKISIIVPVYNVEKYLKHCLDSLINQTMQDIEIICVNDGSKDNSLAILEDYVKRDKRIVLLNQSNSGIDANACEVAYNCAIKENADCLMFSYVKEFGSHSIVNHLFEKKYIVWNADEVKQNFHRRLFGPIGKELAYPQNMDILVSPCMQLFKTSKFVHIQFVDIREVGTFEDGLYQMVLYKDCSRFVYIDEPFYHYLKTNEASVTTRYKADLAEKFQHLWNILKNI